jgi:tRNA modification GTPase
MLPRHQDPITAIATAPGRGAVGIVRVSGRDLKPLLAPLLGAIHADSMRARAAKYTGFLAKDGSAIDHGLAIYFPAPHSYTGEDVIELQAHGGPVVMQLLLARVLEAGAEVDTATQQARLKHLRLAEPGEFTERAFLNDKMDLAQAEAVADLIDASTEAAARSASRSLSGAFSKEVHKLRDALIHLRMLVEATLDFPEEEIDHLTRGKAFDQLHHLREQMTALLAQTRQGALLREGIRVVIAGQPNAGKSSLLNALAGAELAIVTPIAGTTRDKVSETIQINGVPLHIIDTAGLRESSDMVEQIGIARTWDAIADADAVIHLHDLAAHHHTDHSIATQTIATDQDLMRAISLKVPKNVPRIEVWNKMDAVDASALKPHVASNSLFISAKQGSGIDALRDKLLDVAGWQQSASEGLFIARERHVRALTQAAEHLTLSHEHLHAAAPNLDLVAEELRLAHNQLAALTGQFSADDLLGEIFSRFCIGK